MTHVEHRPPVPAPDTGSSRFRHDERENGQRTHATRSIPELIKELRDETILLLRQEVALAKTEMAEKSREYARNASYIAIGGMVAYAGFLFVLGAITYGLLGWFAAMDMSPAIAPWLAPAIVGVIVGAIGAGMVAKGRNTLKNERPTPRRTVESLQENKEWLKRKVR